MALLTFNRIDVFIAELANAEATYDFEKAKQIFTELGWNNYLELPNFEIDEPAKFADILRYAGAFLIRYGKAKNLSLKQNGKEVLGNAQRIYRRLNLQEQFLECELMQAISYLYDGSIQEYEIILKEIQENIPSKKSGLNLMLEANFLNLDLQADRLSDAKKRINSVLKWIDEVADVSRKIFFYNQLGLIYRNLSDYTKSVIYLNLALKLSKKSNNKYFQAIIRNNLAFAYKCDQDYVSADFNITEALNLIESDASGYRGHFLDTKAQILINQKLYETALEFSEASVFCFRQGDDYLGLAESLWTNIEIQLYTEFPTEALELFLELYEISSKFISIEKAYEYKHKFAAKVFIEPSGNLYENLDSYKKNRIRKEFCKSFKKSEIAQNLGISQMALYKIMTHQFPELSAEFEEMLRLTENEHYLIKP